MLRRIEDLPAGTLGFEAVGEVEDDDWEDVVEPVLKEWIAQGSPSCFQERRRPSARPSSRAPRHGSPRTDAGSSALRPRLETRRPPQFEAGITQM